MALKLSLQAIDHLRSVKSSIMTSIKLRVSSEFIRISSLNRSLQNKNNQRVKNASMRRSLEELKLRKATEMCYLQ